MVITKKYLMLLFVGLVVVEIALSSFFAKTISDKKSEFYEKSFSVKELEVLKKDYSKKTQKKELKRIYDFLDMLEIKYKVKKINKKHELVLEMPSDKAQKVIDFIFNRKLNIKEFEIDKVQKDNLHLKVVFL